LQQLHARIEDDPAAHLGSRWTFRQTLLAVTRPPGLAFERSISAKRRARGSAWFIASRNCSRLVLLPLLKGPVIVSDICLI
jgi:hypothetical protein